MPSSGLIGVVGAGLSGLLAAHLLEQAGLVRTQVLLGTRVCGLHADATGPGGAVSVQWERGGQSGTLAAYSVILAVPPRLLASTLRWTPALPTGLSRQWAEAPTWMAGKP